MHTDMTYRVFYLETNIFPLRISACEFYFQYTHSPAPGFKLLQVSLSEKPSFHLVSLFSFKFKCLKKIQRNFLRQEHWKKINKNSPKQDWHSCPGLGFFFVLFSLVLLFTSEFFFSACLLHSVLSTLQW